MARVERASPGHRPLPAAAAAAAGANVFTDAAYVRRMTLAAVLHGEWTESSQTLSR